MKRRINNTISGSTAPAFSAVGSRGQLGEDFSKVGDDDVLLAIEGRLLGDGFVC